MELCVGMPSARALLLSLVKNRARARARERERDGIESVRDGEVQCGTLWQAAPQKKEYGLVEVLVLFLGGMACLKRDVRRRRTTLPR